MSFYTFLSQTFKNFGSTGAIAPSSKALANAITYVVARKLEPIKVLEVGAGTGVFTKKLVKLLDQEDHLDICELNPDFVKYLEKSLKEEKVFKNFEGTVELHPIDVLKLDSAEQYDYIISGLPLNAFPPDLVNQILRKYMELLKPWGWISYFEYIGIRPLKMIVSKKQERERLTEVTNLMRHFIRHHEIFHIPIIRNLPPAYVRHCQKRRSQKAS